MDVVFPVCYPNDCSQEQSIHIVYNVQAPLCSGIGNVLGTADAPTNKTATALAGIESAQLCRDPANLCASNGTINLDFAGLYDVLLSLSRFL